ncbi:MAG: hypothetical protein AAB513_02165 [Patescibacteria group bacterium]
MKHLFRFFDKLEDKVRERLSRRPILYSIIGGSAVILFWRGIWHLADEIELAYSLSNIEGAVVSLLVGGTILLLTGLFSSFFVGDAILISGLRREKKIIEKTEEEIGQETGILKRIQGEVSREESILNEVRKELVNIRSSIESLNEK